MTLVADEHKYVGVRRPTIPLTDVVILTVLAASVATNIYLKIRLDEIRRSPAGPVAGALLPLRGVSPERRSDDVSVGRPLVVFYLTPRCPSCAALIPTWNAIAHRVGQENTLALVPGVAPATLDEFRAYGRSNRLSSRRVIHVDDATIASKGLTEVPMTLVVDASGSVVGAWRGTVDPEVIHHVWRSLVRKEAV